nr:3-methyl-2-oxobutanoate hydroxymethyltransferase [Ardenticatena sp.]
MRDKPVTILDLYRKYHAGDPIVMVTAYDYPSALLADRAGVDVILVGDSLGMVVLGYETTEPVTMEEMLIHIRAVRRGAQRAFIVGDMPFGSYEASNEEAVRHAFRLMKEGRAHAVKLEGGRRMAERVRAIVQSGIPVMGHIGLTPQSVSALGGFRVQGRTANDALALLEDALALQEAGCFAIVLEAVPVEVAAAITERLSIPTIGIGAGNGVSGQVLVYHDLLGMFDRFTPKFVKQYANIGHAIEEALRAYANEVRTGAFPADEHTFHMPETERKAFQQALQTRKT